MDTLDFTSDREGPETPVITVPFRVDKVPFEATMRVDGDALLEWSEMAAAVSASEDLESVAGIAFTSRFFRVMMTAAQYAALRAHMKARKTPPEVVVRIMQGLNAAMEEEVARATARPTRQSSPSSRGHVARDGRTLKIISLSEADGEIEFVDPPAAPRQQVRRQPRKARRRRAG